MLGDSDRLLVVLADLLVEQCLSLPGGAPLLVNCRHRADILPHDPSERILRLGTHFQHVVPQIPFGLLGFDDEMLR